MQTIKELAYIDPTIFDLNGLLANLRPEVEPIVLNQEDNVSAQITQTVLGHADLNAVHIIAHGQSGEIRLASGSLTLDSVSEYADLLTAVGRVLRPGGELLLWSCNTGRDLHSECFIAALERTAGLMPPLGSAAKRIPWALKLALGTVQAHPPLSSIGFPEHGKGSSAGRGGKYGVSVGPLIV